MPDIDIADILLRLPALCIAFTVHEVAHGYTAYRLGDQSAKRDGRLSLNPLKHIDPLGMICLLLFRFGWAKPVMVNPLNLKKPKRDMAIIALAGPLSNVALAVVAVLLWYPIGIRLSGGLGWSLASEFILLNLSLAVFNLLPVPPLDGSKVFTAFMSERDYFRFQERFDRYGFFVLLVLIWAGVTQTIISPLIIALYRGLFAVTGVLYAAFLP
ncbi:MAG: site-2 protease family protein [Lachnospiraceae bacterium]|nr:site-2 protease family protein [Lachnospiraceae bacterium]